MGRFTDLFQENNQPEEVFAPAPVVESAEISAPGLSAPEAVAEEKEVFNPNARDGDGDGLLQEGTPYERPVSERKVRKRI
jgi:hypothetical protein